jgi:superoxide reductase
LGMNLLSYTGSLKKGFYIKLCAVLVFLTVFAASAYAQTTSQPGADPNAYLWTQINRAKDPNNLTSLEQAHVPGINITGPVKAGEPFKVTVRIGEGHMHPSTHDHFIQWIELYNGDLQLAHVDLSPATSKPEVTFTVVLDKPSMLKVRQNCNLHGTWENTKSVNVT